jgi:hypothetical protein
MAKRDRIPVQIDGDTYRRAREYSETTGVPVARLVDKAVNEYLDRHGREHMQTLAVKPTKK